MEETATRSMLLVKDDRRESNQEIDQQEHSNERANLRRALSSAVKLSSLFLFRGCPSDVELLRASELSTASLSTVFDSILSKKLSQLNYPLPTQPYFNYGMSRKF